MTCIGNGRGEYRILVGQPEGKKRLGRHRHRWNLQDVGWGTWNELIWLRIRTGGGHL